MMQALADTIVKGRETVIIKGINRVEIYRLHWQETIFSTFAQKTWKSNSLLATIGLSRTFGICLKSSVHLHKQLAENKAHLLGHTKILQLAIMVKDDHQDFTIVCHDGAESFV
jgi:hypothetical protein